MAVDRNGVIYVSEHGGHWIRKIALTATDRTSPASYTVSTLAGSGASGAQDGIGVAASFNLPEGLAVDDAANLYVADTTNQKIRRVTPAGEVTTVAGTGVAGNADGSGEAGTTRSGVSSSSSIRRSPRAGP